MYIAAIIVTTFLLAVYSFLILQYRKWFLRLKPFSTAVMPEPKTKFSVIIPARNEGNGIAACLHSILQQQYPADLFEVIVINDHSTDNTEAVIRKLQAEYPNLRLINLQERLANKQLNAYKKMAIEMAIAESMGDWIVTTDADCYAPPNWLSTLNACISGNSPVFIAAPVMFTHNGSFLSAFQLLDFISLQGITAAAVSAGYHSMCNGANLAYRKDVFYEAGKFSGIDHVASGDDMLLMHKIKALYPDRMAYLFSPGMIVTTEPMHTWKDFFNQRIRWASKADQYDDKGIFWTLALVYALNAALLLLFPFSFFVEGGLVNWLLFVAVKTGVELSFMIPVARFYNQLGALYLFPVMQPFHITYTVIAGWLGKFGSYQWKGRSVR
ncbi:glycosyltransferase family 2 protein [Sediminibacterium ginsengisoli]|uniref:Glycosyltransferase, catalytic subunit of cellulose synthase and poly-beta-1,6-N-acetylglucosamine synthase n=1 Tax=Sediminibacterium ginsengisoli TaxID=413434 RepID=A0A1T4LWG4_9BACT|nr:glycosyltransferase [Sediminibacterium ginsengisoli]SJZ59083.1 Glycosyltransferase, catalytic subunit of cellulose synthase and poly-beta-1,6-N-acetylglucosamine synthase [Sediminibacterium ginsengisoli]